MDLLSLPKTIFITVGIWSNIHQNTGASYVKIKLLFQLLSVWKAKKEQQKFFFFTFFFLRKAGSWGERERQETGSRMCHLKISLFHIVWLFWETADIGEALKTESTLSFCKRNLHRKGSLYQEDSYYQRSLFRPRFSMAGKPLFSLLTFPGIASFARLGKWFCPPGRGTGLGSNNLHPRPPLVSCFALFLHHLLSSLSRPFIHIP